MKKRNGFTMIEILVVIAVISTLLAISAMSFSWYMRKTNMENQTRTLMNDLLKARSDATFLQRDRRVKLTTTTFSVYSSVIDTVRPVSTKQLVYPIVFSGGGSVLNIDFDGEGFLGSVGNGNASICIDPSGNSASVDSVVVYSTRILAGKRQDGGDCTRDSNNIQFE